MKNPKDIPGLKYYLDASNPSTLSGFVCMRKISIDKNGLMLETKGVEMIKYNTSLLASLSEGKRVKLDEYLIKRRTSSIAEGLVEEVLVQTKPDSRPIINILTKKEKKGVLEEE